jgi:hypothetical protein
MEKVREHKRNYMREYRRRVAEKNKTQKIGYMYSNGVIDILTEDKIQLILHRIERIFQHIAERLPYGDKLRIDFDVMLEVIEEHVAIDTLL